MVAQDMGRNGVGPVAVMLASDDCAHMTGMVFFVDGGAHINGLTSPVQPAQV